LCPRIKRQGICRSWSVKSGEALSENTIDYEIIIVDDDSNDGIEEAVSRLKDEYKINLITRKNKRGFIDIN
jgi:glycosyltransferase involved in cell wall biosynthesis